MEHEQRQARPYDVLVVGGGNGGVSLAARVLRDARRTRRDLRVGLVSDSAVHAYRPLLNYVGGGEARMGALERSMRQVLPDGCAWIDDAVTGVDAGARTVVTRAGRSLSYRSLVLAPGLTEAWGATPGLADAYADGWAGSTFVTASAPAVWPALRRLRTGTVVFTVPPEPSPCGATALKPLFMACDHWRREGVLGDLDVRLVLPPSGVVGIERVDALVDRHLDGYGVRVHRDAEVAAVDRTARTVRLTVSGGAEETIAGVAYAHVVPQYRGHGWVIESGLAALDGPGAGAGLVDVDPETLRHRRHPDVWALGDAADLRTRSSGGALRKQVDVLADNLRRAGADGERDLRRYDGYTVAPITTARRRLMLAEFDRSGRLTSSVPGVDPLTPRRATWFFDRFGLPQVYWHRILKGRV